MALQLNSRRAAFSAGRGLATVRSVPWVPAVTSSTSVQRYLQPTSRGCGLAVRAQQREEVEVVHQVDQPVKPIASSSGQIDAPSSTGVENWMPASQLWSKLGVHDEGFRLLALAGGAALLAAPAFGTGYPGNITSQPLFVAQALGVLALIVAVHEAGHFAAARLQGIHVTKFAIGFGPALWSVQRGEVEYSLRAVPLGGYVAFPDDDPNSPYPIDDPNLLRNRTIPERAAVISAGVIANIIFAYASLLIQVATVGKAETAYLPGVNMPSVDRSSVAAAAGFKSGDVITAVSGYTVPASADQVGKVVSIIKANAGRELQFTVQRQGAPVLVNVVPEEAPSGGFGRIGVSLTPNTRIAHIKGATLDENLAIATAEFNRLASTVIGGLKAIITNFAGVANQVSGPVAIVKAGADIAKTDSAGLFQFCAIVNLNLAVVNLLPLPALDGGYLLLLALEAIRGKKLPERLEQGFMASGFLLLMAMGVSLVVKDTIGLLPGL